MIDSQPIQRQMKGSERTFKCGIQIRIYLLRTRETLSKGYVNWIGSKRRFLRTNVGPLHNEAYMDSYTEPKSHLYSML